MAVESIDVVAGSAPARENCARTLPNGPTVTAFVGRTERGPIDEAVRIDSFDAYRRMFGGHTDASYVSYAVQQYFMHGGESAVVVRVANGATRGALEVPAGAELLRLQARRPGARELLRVSIDYDGVASDPGRFNLVVQRLDRPGSQLVEDQELFPAVSVDPEDSRFIVDALESSQLVSVCGPLPAARPDATAPKHPGQAIPYIGMTRPGSDGGELTDYDVVGSNEEGTGIFALGSIPRVDLLCIPAAPGRDVGPTAFVAAERYCQRRRALLLWDPPWSWQSADAALQGVRALGLAGRNSMTYFPRIRPRAEYARFPAGLPACGAVAGMLARTDRERLLGLSSTASLKASVTTAADVTERQASMLARRGVNALVRKQGGHVVLEGDVCLVAQHRGAGAHRHLGSHRTALLALKCIESAARASASELGDADASARLASRVRELLERMHELGSLAGARPQDSYFVRTARRGAAPDFELMLRVGFCLEQAGDFLIYEIRCRDEGLVTRAVPALD